MWCHITSFQLALAWGVYLCRSPGLGLTLLNRKTLFCALESFAQREIPYNHAKELEAVTGSHNENKNSIPLAFNEYIVFSSITAGYYLGLLQHHSHLSSAFAVWCNSCDQMGDANSVKGPENLWSLLLDTSLTLYIALLHQHELR